MDYNARFYSPALGRFIQPDSIIPDLTNSQAWNRYSYVLNSPIMYMDPSGRWPDGPGDDHAPCPDGDCRPLEELQSEWMLDYGVYGKSPLRDPLKYYDITIKFNGLSEGDQIQFMVELLWVIKNSSHDFKENFMRGRTFNVLRKHKDGRGKFVYFPPFLNRIELFDQYIPGTITHEIFHQIDFEAGQKLSKAFENYIGANTYYESVGPFPLPYNSQGLPILIQKYSTGPQVQIPPSYAPAVPNRKEDFAESVEEYFGYGLISIDPNQLRWEFIHHLLETGEILTP